MTVSRTAEALALLGPAEAVSADDLLRVLTQAVFVAVFAGVALGAVRRRRPANVDAALPFGAVAVIVAAQWAADRLGLAPAVSEHVSAVAALALPYLLLRVLRHFAPVPRWLSPAALALLVAGAVSAVAVEPRPAWLRLAYVGYIVGLALYVAVAFLREVPRSRGVFRRRLQAIAVGSALLALAILLVALRAESPVPVDWLSVAGRLLGLGAGLAYAVGFAPPTWLRRVWQEPELRAFVAGGARLARLAGDERVIRQLERTAADALGVPNATIGLWDEGRGVLRYHRQAEHGPSAGWLDLPPGKTIGGRAFAEGRPIFSDDAERDDPASAPLYRRGGARAVYAAPIATDERRLGVLTLYAPRAPVFAEDDLALAGLLAEHAGVILEHRRAIVELAQVAARAEAVRLKEDFLSSAAHDLNTPLTTVIAEAQVLARRLPRDPAAPANLAGVRRIAAEAARLRTVIRELMDVAAAGTELLIGERELLNLAAVADAACQQYNSERHPCRREGDDEAIGRLDPIRVTQLVDHLIDNAIKYSPEGGEIVVLVTRRGETLRLEVRDAGIGIAAEELPGLFERFGRGRHVDDRRFVGMGLGLYLCRVIAEQHGGRIWATSAGPGHGSTFHVELPAQPPAPPTAHDPVGRAGAGGAA